MSDLITLPTSFVMEGRQNESHQRLAAEVEAANRAYQRYGNVPTVLVRVIVPFRTTFGMKHVGELIDVPAKDAERLIEQGKAAEAE